MYHVQNSRMLMDRLYENEDFLAFNSILVTRDRTSTNTIDAVNKLLLKIKINVI